MAAAFIGEAILSASLEVLFDRLASQKVIDFFKGRKLSELLEKLKITMRSVKVLLGDAEEKQITNGDVRKWLDDLKDAFYEADDLLDEITYAALSWEMEAGRPQTSIGRAWNFLSSQGPLVKIESKLVEIHEKLQLLIKQKNVLGLKEATGDKPWSQNVPITSLMDETTSLMDESVVYGRDKDIEAIIQLLLSDDANCNKLGLIPIVGMGGVGKTTLTQSVYNDSRVEKWFESKAWIFVSAEFNVLEITKKILNDVSTKKPDFNTLITLDNLHVALKNQLSDKKFLLVLDNVWSDRSEHWDSLLRPLKAGAQGSKIIITTRLESVASVLNVQSYPLEKLSEEECWPLFSKYAFDGRSSGASTILKEIGRQIVRKCDGLPLAAKSLGCLLRNNVNPEEWRGVLENNIWNLPNLDSLPALRVSYYFLPSHLKQCFAYCAIFPKGYLFKKEELVLLWMGEGFLGPAGSSMGREVTGEKYFDDLVARSFFNPNGDDYRPGFIMHDLMNDLARSVTGEFCFSHDDSREVPTRTRHLHYFRRNILSSNISEGIANISESIAGAPLLRTFLLAHHHDDWKYDDGEVIYDTHALMKFKHLRVLSLHVYRRAVKLKLDDSIGNLKHLRHLDLSKTSIQILPQSLCSLYHLEILLLTECFLLRKLPSNLGNLANLCVLDITGTHWLRKMPPQMGKLKKLQKLSHFVIGKKIESSIQELGNLQQLRGRLVISHLENVTDVGEVLSANVKGKTHLKELELVWNYDVDDPLHAISILEQLKPHDNVETLTIRGYGGLEFPNWIHGGSLLLGVVTLNLGGCRHCSKLPPLGQLVHLKQLLIRDFPNIVVIGPEFYGRCTPMKKPFQRLEVLRFEKMPQWQEWIMCGNEEVFHLLRELYISFCPAFEQSLPQYLPSLTTLQALRCERLVASLPRAPRILKMNLDGFELSDGIELSAFRPHSSLNEGIEHPLIERIEQLGLFNTLQEVRIEQCDLLKCFPLESFLNLKDLCIDDCPNLETINGNCISLISLKIRKCPNLVSFLEVGLKTPDLQRLELKDCLNLKWLPESMHSLPHSLEKLYIRNCPKLESFPNGGLPLKLQTLKIVGCSQLINGCNKWNLHCLPNLLDFEIGGYRDAECFPEELLLPSTLTSLGIKDFPNLKYLEYKGYQHLTSLQSLTVHKCPELRLLPEEGLPSSLASLRVKDLQNLEFVVNSKIQQLANLQTLVIVNCPKLKSVPEEGLPSTVTSLIISGFVDLESLDSKGLQNLTSLKRMNISKCPKLQSLPKNGLPLSLFSLLIWDCPLLEKRCEREKGEDWPKISHISRIYFD